MGEIRSIDTPEQLADFAGWAGLPPLEPQLLSRHQPDAHWVLTRSQQIVAYCSAWWRQVPAYPDHLPGLIGHYAAIDAEAAAQILTDASDRLAAQGCTIAIAPIDGSTWRRYRLICERGSEPLFFLELDNPDAWRDQFAAAGFEPIAHYRSALNADLTQRDPRTERTADRLAQAGVQIRSLNMSQFEQELDAVYGVSLVSFRDNLLYTPIERSEFMAQYRQIQPLVQPELVLMAEQDGQLVGFLFAVPDWLQAQRGEPVTTAVIKTVAVLPGRRFAGLGSVLVDRVQAIARELGYARAIHALMYDGNRSGNISRRYAQTMRRYALLGRQLVANPTDKIPN